MTSAQDTLWAAAAAACERLAAGLAPGGQPNYYDDADHLSDALEALAREPAPRPTAEFVRHATAAAAAAASLAAARPIAVPTNATELRAELNRWSTAGYTAVLLLRAVCHGCLQGLETKQAFALASAFLVLTDGVPPALLCLWGPLQQAAVLQSDLQTEALSLAGRTCTAIAQTLNITTKPLGSSPGPEQAAAAGAAQPRTVDRLRSTSARPAHIVAALDNLTTLMQLGSPYAAHIQEGRKAMNEWLGLATFVLTDKLCAEEQRRLEQQLELQQKVTTLAAVVTKDLLRHARACCAEPGSLRAWQSRLAQAADMLTSSPLLPVSAPLLASREDASDSIDDDEPGDLVSAAARSLEAALYEVAAGEPATAAAAATRALQLAAFAADCCAAAGAAAGLQPAMGACQVAIVGRTNAELAQLQLRLLLRSHSVAPAALAAVDAALQHGVLGARPGSEAAARQAKARADNALLSVGRFASWLGTSGAQVEESVLAERPAEAATSAAAAWLLLTRRTLQLHAQHADGGDFARASKPLHLYLCSLAEGSRGLADLHLQASMLAERSRQPERATASGGSLDMASTAGTAGTALEPGAALAELPTIQQLATAVCLLAHKAAAAGPQRNTRSLRLLFCCGEGEPAAVGVVEQLLSAVNGLSRVLEGSGPSLPSSPGNTSAEAPLLADRRLGITLLELTAAGAVLLDAVVALPAVARARSRGRPLGLDLSATLRRLAISAQMVAMLAQGCGQQAVSVEAERLFGRALKLAMDAGAQTQLQGASWMSVTRMLRQPRPMGLELVATGALDTAIGWLQVWLASLSGGWTEDWQPIVMMAVQSGIATALLAAAPLLVPPLEPGSAPASGAALEAASAQQVEQHLGLSGFAAQAAAALLVRRSTADPTQAERCLLQLINLVSTLSGQLGELQDLIDALLPRLKELAAERGRAGSPAAQELALERCAALRRRRCAHLGCTNVPLLLGVGPGGGGEQPKSYKCAGCHAARFCGTACSRADWRVHKHACRQLAAAREAEAAGGEQQA